MFYQSFTVGRQTGDQFNNDTSYTSHITTNANADCAVSEITENFFS